VLFHHIGDQANYIERALKELNDKEKMKLIGLIGNLKTNEMKRKVKEEKVLK